MSALTILVVDDNSSDIYLLRHALHATGIAIEITAVSGGLAALEYLRENPRPDLIVIDFLLCGETGYDVLRLLSIENLVASPTVLLSGLVPQECSNRIGRPEISVLEKPCSLEGWLHLAGRILESLLPPTPEVRAA